MRKKAPTKNVEALNSFTRGRVFFDSYLDTENLDDLSKAAECFALSVALDPNFNTARFYRAVSQTEQGNPTEAVKELEALIRGGQFRFRLDARMQLSRSYAKNREYDKAQQQVAQAKKEIEKDGHPDLRCLIEAHSASLLAAQGPGDLQRLGKAIELAHKTEQNITKKSNEIALAARFEANVAAGIAHMWLYDQSGGQEDTHWTEAQRAFLSASELRPRSPRVLGNMGKLYICRGHYDQKERKESYELAERFFTRILDINPFDEVARHTKDLLDRHTRERATAEEQGLQPEQIWVSIKEKEESLGPPLRDEPSPSTDKSTERTAEHLQDTEEEVSTTVDAREFHLEEYKHLKQEITSLTDRVFVYVSGGIVAICTWLLAHNTMGWLNLSLGLWMISVVLAFFAVIFVLNIVVRIMGIREYLRDLEQYLHNHNASLGYSGWEALRKTSSRARVWERIALVLVGIVLLATLAVTFAIGWLPESPSSH